MLVEIATAGTNNLLRVVFTTVNLGETIILTVIGKLLVNDTEEKYIVVEGTGQYSKTKTKIKYEDIRSFNFIS